MVQGRNVRKKFGPSNPGFGLTLKKFFIKHFKPEIRISNIETNAKFECSNFQNKKLGVLANIYVLFIMFGIFVIRYCFGFRTSNFEFVGI